MTYFNGKRTKYEKIPLSLLEYVNTEYLKKVLLQYLSCWE